MSPTIERIEVAGPEGRARRLFFTGSIEPRVTSAAVVRHLALEVGGHAASDEISTAEAELVRERALAVLGYRERSTRELRDRLRADGYDPSLVDSLVRRFVELSLVDDERFARMWTRSRTAAGYGRQRIARELAVKGIAPELAAQVIDGESGDQLAPARSALRGKAPQSPKERTKLVNRLLRRGFDLSTALAATAPEADVGSDNEPFIAE